jgi:hypothetical protein
MVARCVYWCVQNIHWCTQHLRGISACHVCDKCGGIVPESRAYILSCILRKLFFPHVGSQISYANVVHLPCTWQSKRVTFAKPIRRDVTRAPYAHGARISQRTHTKQHHNMYERYIWPLSAPQQMVDSSFIGRMHKGRTFGRICIISLKLRYHLKVA